MPVYNRGKLVILDASLESEAPVDLVNDVVKVALMKTTYSPDIDADSHFDDIVAAQISATNYTSRGAALASKAITQNNTDNRAEFGAANLTFSTIGGASNDTFDTIVVLREPDSSASDANSVLIAYQTVGATTTNGGNITLTWNSAGIIHLT